MKSYKRLMWTNKLSQETGYVKTISVKKGYFENTNDVAEARKFRSEKECEKAIATLIELGEAENNDFSVIEA